MVRLIGYFNNVTPHPEYVEGWGFGLLLTYFYYNHITPLGLSRK